MRLQPHMEAKSLWRTGLYLESSSGTTTKKVKVLIRAHLEVNELEVSVRGAEVSVARGILGIVGKEISEVIKNYAGITLTAKDDEPAEEASEKWWNFQASEHGEWETKLFGLSSIKALPIVKDGVPLVPELFEKFKMALESLGGMSAELKRPSSL